VSSRRPLSSKTALVGNESRFCRSKRPRDQSFTEEFSDMGWVGGVVSSVSCRANLHLLGMKVDFVWARSAGQRISCGVLFHRCKKTFFTFFLFWSGFCRISVTIINVAVQFLNDPLCWRGSQLITG